MEIRIPKSENPHVGRSLVEEVVRELREWASTEGIVLNESVKENSRSYYIYLRPRLTYRCYNTYAYTSSGNYFIEEDEEGRPIAVNIYYPHIRKRVKKMNVLQWCHWAKLDNKINEVLDRHDIHAIVKSAWGIIRKGKLWGWIDPNNPQHEAELHKHHKKQQTQEKRRVST